ncbi:MAG TPA: cyanophycin synthetase, partial [Terriglobales bacterium]
RLCDGSLLQLGHGKKQRRVQATISGLTSHIAVDIAGDKELTKKLLDEAAVPVPKGRVVRSCEGALEAGFDLGFPLAIKPLDGNHGRGVSLHIRTAEDVVFAFEKAQEHSSRVIVEQMLDGRDYRVVVVGGKLVAASERIPAHVIADGVHTISELIEIENRNPLRGEGHEKPLTKLDPEAALAVLARAGRTLQSIASAGELVYIRDQGNISTGGVAKDVTDAVSPEVRDICERAARAVGLDVCGIDLITPDISQPMPPRAGIIEVNAAPGIRMHHYPNEGTPRDVAGAIVRMLFPNAEQGRIPIISITGTNGKTTVTRMVTHGLSDAGCYTGLTTTDGIGIGGKQVVEGDTTGPWSARLVLADPAVDVAVLETARGGIVRSGLGYDWSDIGVMLNIQSDHIGQDGIHTLEDILHIKSLVAERVREGGTVILNADDPLLATLMDRPRMQEPVRSVVYFSERDHNPLIQRHLSNGGTAFINNSGMLVESVGNERRMLGRASEFPVTLYGTARFQIANVLAAIAACRSYGLSAHFVVESLKRFDNSSENRGRANLYSVNGGHVLVDYGHNIGAFRAICDMTSNWHSVCVTGVVTVPGDRSDELLDEAARVVACGFDRIIIREDDDRRGREPGEIAELLRKAMSQDYPDLPLEVVLDETESYRRALTQIRPGEVVVMFYDNYNHAMEVLRAFGAAPVESGDELFRVLEQGSALRAA